MAKSTNALKYVALYCRLSRDDGLDSESNSIQVQRLMLSKYAAENNLNPNRFYVDDGYSGANFERPGFKQMLADADAGKIHTIIVKDMSRFGRNYLEVGYYTEQRFPQLGIRFIAINDGVDSNDELSSEFAPFRNIINEWYCRDSSRKMKSSYKTRASYGYHLAGAACYGYQLDPANGKHLVIDPVAADVVRKIYTLFLDGHSIRGIATQLTEEGIPAPREYKQIQGIPFSKGVPALVSAPLGWRANTVRQILDNYIYCGHSVSLKTTVPSYKTHKKVRTDRNDWVIVHNTHEPIVDEETFNRAKKLRTIGKKIRHPCNKGPLNLLLYCADCGGRMYYRPHHNRSEDPDPDRTGGFFCGMNNTHRVCSPHSIPRNVLEAGVLANLQRVTSLARDSEDEFLSMLEQKVGNRPPVRSQKAASELAGLKLRVAEIDNIINRLFEQNVAGTLSDSRFQTMLNSFENEHNELSLKIANLQNLIGDEGAVDADTERKSRFLALVHKYTNITELTLEITTAFIRRILVRESTGTGRWDKQYSVEIEYNFVGTIPLMDDLVPCPELEIARIIEFPSIRDYLMLNDSISNAKVRELTGMTTARASGYLRRLIKAGIISRSSPQQRDCLRTIDLELLDKVQYASDDHSLPEKEAG